MTPRYALHRLKPGQTGVITDVNAKGLIRQRLFDLGFLPGTKIQALFPNPAGNPVAYLIRGTIIALRLREAKQIKITFTNIKGENVCLHRRLLP